MGTRVLNYADSNLPTFITRVVEVEEPLSWDEDTTQEEKRTWLEEEISSNTINGANGAPQVFVFETRKD